MARLAGLTSELSAPTTLSKEQSARIQEHYQVVELARQSKDLTHRIKRLGYSYVIDARDTELFRKKTKVQARLNCCRILLRNQLLRKARKQHFRTANTPTFDAQFLPGTGSTSREPLKEPTVRYYNLDERADLVRLIYAPRDGACTADNLERRLQAITARVALYRRREAQRRGRPTLHRKEEEASEDTVEEAEHIFPMVCQPTQYIFYLSDKKLPYQHRVFKYT